MNECRRTAERLASYADGALAPAEHADVERHLDRCLPCRTAASHEQGGRTLLRECAPRLKAEPLPPGLRTRCEAIARAHASPRWLARWRPGFFRAFATTAALLLLGIAVLSVATQRSNTVLAAQLTADHMKCFRTVGQSPSSADSRIVEERLEDEYGWDVHIPPSSDPDGIQLIGARRCLYAEGAIPHVLYRVHGRDVSLYMLEGVQRTPAEVRTLGHRSRIWSRGATTYVMVSSAPAADFARAAQYVMQQAH